MFCSVTPMPAALSERLETTVCGVGQTRHADFFALEVSDALDVAVARDEQLGAAGVQAGGELDIKN